MGDKTVIIGSCHCRNIRYIMHWPSSAPVIAVRECGCTFCRKHGGAWTSHRDAELSIEVRDRAKVAAYRFGTATADFCVCATCGVTPFVLSEIDDVVYAVVNVNTFDDAKDFTFTSSSTDFDGEDAESRLERRRRNWIPAVTGA